MKKTTPTILLLAALASTQALAFGEVGRWSSGYAQGTTEYIAVVSKGNQLYMACPGSGPVSMTLTVNGVDYGTYSKKGFDLVIDGTNVQTPYNTDSRVGESNFLYAWKQMRKAKSLVAKTSDGKSLTLPLQNIAKVLPGRTNCYTALEL